MVMFLIARVFSLPTFVSIKDNRDDYEIIGHIFGHNRCEK